MSTPTGCMGQGCRVSSRTVEQRFAGACTCLSEINEALKLIRMLRTRVEVMLADSREEGCK